MKFQYGTKVKVTNGFYKGLEGHVIKYFGVDNYQVDVIGTLINGKLTTNPIIEVAEADLTLAK